MIALIVALSIMPYPRFAVSSAAMPAAASPDTAIVRPGSRIKAAILQEQTGNFVMHRADLGSDGIVETIGIIDGGRLVDWVARRNGVLLAKLQSTLPVVIPLAADGQLLAFGIDQPITDSERKAAFQRAIRAAVQANSRQDTMRESTEPSTLIFFDIGNDPFFARWGFGYRPGRSLSFHMAADRVMFALTRR